MKEEFHRRADDVSLWAQVSENKADIASLKEQMNRLQGGFERVLNRFEDKMDALNKKMDEKFDAMDTKMDNKFQATDAQIATVRTEFADMKSRFKGGWWVVGIAGGALVGLSTLISHLAGWFK